MIVLFALSVEMAAQTADLLVVLSMDRTGSASTAGVASDGIILLPYSERGRWCRLYAIFGRETNKLLCQQASFSTRRWVVSTNKTLSSYIAETINLNSLLNIFSRDM